MANSGVVSQALLTLGPAVLSRCGPGEHIKSFQVAANAAGPETRRTTLTMAATLTATMRFNILLGTATSLTW